MKTLLRRLNFWMLKYQHEKTRGAMKQRAVVAEKIVQLLQPEQKRLREKLLSNLQPDQGSNKTFQVLILIG